MLFRYSFIPPSYNSVSFLELYIIFHNYLSYVSNLAAFAPHLHTYIDSRTFGSYLKLIPASFFISLFIWLGKEFEIDLSKRWAAESEMLEFIEPMAPVVIEVVKPVFPAVGGVQKLKDLVEGFKDAAPDR
jgi:hypothetical protein